MSFPFFYVHKLKYYLNPKNIPLKNTYTKTIKQQNVEGAEKAIAGTLISGGASVAGVGTVGKVVTALGFGNSIKTVLTGGNTHPLIIKERVYKKTNRTQSEKMRYYGYSIVDVYNKDTGKKVSSKKVSISKNSA